MCSNQLSYSGVFLRTLQAVIPVLRVQIYGKFFIPAKLLHKKIKKIIFVPMKRFMKISVIALFTLIYGVSDAKIIFKKISHDFGEITEDGGIVEHNFHFRNTSDKPAVIVAAYSSCGCTKAEFSRKPIMADSSSVVKVIFNPMNYPGTFARKVFVSTADGEKIQLLITGKVTPRQRSLEERYPIDLGDGLRAATNAHSFGYLEHGRAKQSTFEIVNTSSRKVALSIENPYPELEFFYPETIGAGEEAVLNFVCSLPDNSEKYGSLDYVITLLANGKIARYPFIINGLAIDFCRENANNSTQMIAVSEKSIKFGAVKCAHTIRARVLELYNTGTQPLAIRKLELNGEGFGVKMEGDSTIEAGGKRELLIEIDPSRLPFGAVVEKLRIISNDPKTPVLTIRVSAIVEG